MGPAICWSVPMFSVLMMRSRVYGYHSLLSWSQMASIASEAVLVTGAGMAADILASLLHPTTGAQRGAGCHCKVQMIGFTHCELLQIYGFQGTCLAILPIFIHFLVRFQRFA